MNVNGVCTTRSHIFVCARVCAYVCECVCESVARVCASNVDISSSIVSYGSSCHVTDNSINLLGGKDIANSSRGIDNSSRDI